MPEHTPTEDLAQRVRDLELLVQDLRDREQRLAEEIAWRRLLIDQSRDAIVVLDERAGVHEANRKFADMLGYTPAEVARLHAWDWDVNLGREQILELAGGVDHTGHCFETTMRRKDGSLVDVELCNNGARAGGRKLIFCVCRDISARTRAQREREELIGRLQASLAEIRTLQGIVPLCMFCKKVRDDEGYWEQVESYLGRHTGADVTHGLCPECFRSNYPDEYAERDRD